MSELSFLGPLIVSISGKEELTESDIYRLSHPAVGGVILFSRNYDNPEQITHLIESIHALRSPKLLVTVDHEGGRVQRFKKDFTLIPAARDLGEHYDVHPEEAVALAFDIGVIIGYELSAVGVDLTYAPVLDIDYRANDVIGDRAFHRDPDVVIALAESFIKGLSLSGVRCVGKHYPGHGAVKADSHISQAIDERDLEELQPYLKPYYALRYCLPAIMPAWVSYPKVDRFPACLSSFWLKYLREEIEFSQCIISDDLSMEGAAIVPSLKERVYKTLEAGCDMLCLCDILIHPHEIDSVLKDIDMSLLVDCQKWVSRLRALSVDRETLEPHYRQAKVHLSDFVNTRLLPSLS